MLYLTPMQSLPPEHWYPKALCCLLRFYLGCRSLAHGGVQKESRPPSDDSLVCLFVFFLIPGMQHACFPKVFVLVGPIPPVLDIVLSV